MSLLSRASDLFYTFRFLRLLTTRWEDTSAYKLGLIDKKGARLRKPKTDEERSSYNTFHRLVFNLKKLINKLPLGKTTLASYLAALWMIKEHTGMSDSGIRYVVEKATNSNLPVLLESTWYLREGTLEEGSYRLARDILASDGITTILEGSVIKTGKHVGSIFGVPVFEAYRNSDRLSVTNRDIIK